MAEFHDGDRNAGTVGWDFWADASAIESLKIADQRYWSALTINTLILGDKKRSRLLLSPRFIATALLEFQAHR
jgi:hypothetical protein